MPNAKDYKSGKERFLVCGRGGAGKTAGFLTLPGKKFCYVFDPNALDTLRGQDVDYEEFIAEHIDLDIVALKEGVRDGYSRAPEPKTYIEFERHFEKAIQDGFFDKYDVIGFDSSTSLQDIIMDRVQWLNGRFGKWPEQADWTATMNSMIKVFRTLTALDKIIYVTAHVNYMQDSETSRMENIPNFIGRLRNKLPLLFSNIWLCFADRDKNGNPCWVVQTVPDRVTPFLRSSLRGLAPEEDVTIDWTKNPVGQGIGLLYNESTR